MRGEELTPWLIRYGYEQGAFPMTMEDGEIDWFRPVRRALFPNSGVHVSKSLEKRIRRADFEVRFDLDFDEVIRACVRPGDNWLSEHFFRAYGEVFREGWGHCAAVWMNGELAGGVYGVALGSCFCAESMFHRKTDASKLALWALVNRCRELGFTIFDAQIMNPHLKSLGAYEVSDEEYMALLGVALGQKTIWSKQQEPRNSSGW
ncbi:MAG TPA: leucyl/phenylalanyl-tRNA--protein transferase [Fimbriimonadaceae bacterium]|jgi:leucyl/phenylalanyl-tRNA--protein transferase